MSYKIIDEIALGNYGATPIRKPADVIISKNGKVYYKSLYDTAKKYAQRNKEKINEINKKRYKDNEEYRLKTIENSRRKYFEKKRLNEEIKELFNISL